MHKGKIEGSASVIMLGELTRKVPEAMQESNDYVAVLLGGLMALPERQPDSEWQDEDAALAVLAIRNRHPKHPCTHKKPDDPPCRHKHHWRDVALVKDILAKAGLPGDLSVLPLADAAKDYYRRTHE